MMKNPEQTIGNIADKYSTVFIIINRSEERRVGKEC